MALLAARFEVMKELRQRFPFVEEGLLMSKLIAYCSKEVIREGARDQRAKSDQKGTDQGRG